MIYLLQHADGKYLLLERTDDIEYVANQGAWTSEIPTSFKGIHTYGVEQDTNGKIVNWWLTKYVDYTDAKLICRRKTFAAYLQWTTEHPELFI